MALREGIGTRRPGSIIDLAASGDPGSVDRRARGGQRAGRRARRRRRAFDARTGGGRAWDPVPPGYLAEADEDRASLHQRHAQHLVDHYGRRGRGSSTSRPATRLRSLRGHAGRLDYYGARRSLSMRRPARSSGTISTSTTSGTSTRPAADALQLDGVGDGRPGLPQTTKMGHVYLLDRETGEPLYRGAPCPARAYPRRSSATQPFPTHPAPLHPLDLDPDDAFGLRRSIVGSVGTRSRSTADGIYTPPTTEGSIQYPHTSGGMKAESRSTLRPA